MTGTTAALWSRLAAAGIVAGNLPREPEATAPWYVRLMLGLAGCIAAGFLIGFVGIGLSFLTESTAGSIAAGLAMIGAAYGLFLAARSDFSSMFGFAVSCAGQALLAIGVFKLFGNDRSAAPWAMLGAIQALLALAMPNAVQRFASAAMAPILLAIALGMHGAVGLAAGLLAACVAVLWLNELKAARYHEALAPIGYGLTLSLAYIEAELTDASLAGFLPSPGGRWAPPWAGEALALAALLLTAVCLARRAGLGLREPRMLLTATAVAVLGGASFTAPGIAAGLMIVLLGFGNGNRLLTGAGIAALLFYVSKYYYVLDATLLVKAGVLAATGVALLAVRWLILHVVLTGGRADA